MNKNPGGLSVQLLDWFVRPQFGGQADQLAQARVLVVIQLLNALLYITGIAFTTSSASLGPAANWIAGFILLPTLLVNLSWPFVLRWRPWLKAGRELTLATSTFTVIGSAFVQGGPLHSTSNPLILLIIILAFLLCGHRGGIRWAATVIALELVLFALEYRNFQFIDWTTPQTIRIAHTFNYWLALLATTAVMLAFETNRRQLERERDRERERYRYLATHDSLTRLASRRLFRSRLKAAASDAQRKHSGLLLLYIDLNDFKPINDRHGHATGDRVLRIIGERLSATSRSSDTVARLGGDEFAVLLPQFTDPGKIAALCEQVYEKISQPIHLYGQFFRVTASIGAAMYPRDAANADALQIAADTAMYAAKRRGCGWIIGMPEERYA